MNYRLLLLCLFCALHSYSQQDSNLLEHVIDSKAFGTKRKISIYLPSQYKEEAQRKFVVAYLFDGQFQPYMSMVSSMMEYYSQASEGIPLIIVSIHSDDRQAEFIPKISEEDVNSKTHLLSEHLKQEVIPYIEANYRTEKYKLGIGHSLGATFLLSSIFNNELIFDGIIAASPNMELNGEQLVKAGKLFIQNNKNASPYIYAAVGNKGEMENSFRSSLLRFDSIVKKDAGENFHWRFRVMDKEDHMSSFVKTYNDALLDFSEKWNIPKEKLRYLSYQLTSGEVKVFFSNHAQFTKTDFAYNVSNLTSFSKKLAAVENYDAAMLVIDMIIAEIKLENLSKTAEKEKIEKLETTKKYYRFYDLSSSAKRHFTYGGYSESSALYLMAFEVGVKNGTHMERVDAVRAFAQTGHIDEAFTQLNLLADYFKWQGSAFFVNDPGMEVFKKDKRWAAVMKKLDKNKVE